MIHLNVTEKIAPYFQTFTEDFQSEVIEKDEWHSQNIFKLIALLTIWLNREHNSGENDGIQDDEKRRNCLKWEAVYWHFFGKMKQVGLTKYKFWYGGMSKPVALAGISVLPRFHCTEEKRWLLTDCSNNVNFFYEETLKKQIKSAGSFGEAQVWKSEWVKS